MIFLSFVSWMVKEEIPDIINYNPIKTKKHDINIIGFSKLILYFKIRLDHLLY